MVKMMSVLFKSKLFAGWRWEPSSVSCGYNVPSVKRIGVTSPKVISVFMGGLTIKKAYDRICLEDFRQTCFGRVVGVWGRRGSIAFLIFYGSKFNVGWFGCHPGCNELRKYNRVLQLSKMSKNCINALKNKTETTRSTGRGKQGDISHWPMQGQRNLALYLLLFTSSIEEKKPLI